MIRNIILIALLTISGHTFATECGDFSQSFKSTYDVFYSSHEEVLVRDKHQQKNFNKIISLGSKFKGNDDRHGQITYVLKSVNEDKIEFEYRSKFDARSLGGSLEICSGVIKIKI